VSATRTRRAVPMAWCLLLGVLLGGCARHEPLGPGREPARPRPAAPAGEHAPVPSLEDNPLALPEVVVVACTPQGRPLAPSEEARRCAESDACRVDCEERPSRTPATPAPGED